MGILCISMGQPASLARRISADTTWGQRYFYEDDDLDDGDLDDLDGDDLDDLDGDDDLDDLDDLDGDGDHDCVNSISTDTTWGRRDFYEES